MVAESTYYEILGVGPSATVVGSGGVVVEGQSAPRSLTSVDEDYFEALGCMAWPMRGYEAEEGSLDSYLALVAEAITVLTAVDDWGQVAGPAGVDIALHPGLLTVDGIPYLAPLLFEEGREIGVTKVMKIGRNMLELTDGGRWLGVARPLEDLGGDALDHWLLDGSDIISEYAEIAERSLFYRAGLLE